MRPLDKHLHWALNYHIGEIGKQLGGMDVMSIVSPIVPGIDEKVRGAIESKKEKKPQIAIILETPGGVVEVVERAVEVIRHFYQEVAVIVPNQAMSAGTVFALSADRILMDYFSRLGPIDPQIVKDDRLIPALAYLKKFLITHKFQPQLTGDRATEESAQRHERVEEPDQRVGSGG